LAWTSPTVMLVALMVTDGFSLSQPAICSSRKVRDPAWSLAKKVFMPMMLCPPDAFWPWLVGPVAGSTGLGAAGAGLGCTGAAGLGAATGPDGPAPRLIGCRETAAGLASTLSKGMGLSS